MVTTNSWTAEAEPVVDSDPVALQRQLADVLTGGGDATELLGRIQAGEGTRNSRAQIPKPRHARQFNAQLERLRLRLSIVINGGSLTANQLHFLFSDYRSVKAGHLLVQQRFQVVGDKLVQSASGPEFGQRLDDARNVYDEKSLRLLEPLDPLLKTYESAEDQAALAADDSFAKQLRKAALKVIRQIEPYSVEAEPRILGNRFLPYRTLTLPQRQPSLGPVIEPGYLNPDENNAPAAEDLAATVDAPLSPEILAQAEALGNDYIRIYEFVKNEIRTEWYAGAMKGAVGTLRQKAGNDIDQASLLIALFRASGLASRYVRGVVELPIDAVGDSLGLTSAAQVTRALNLAGVAYAPVIRGGRIAAVNVEHTWVSAYVPYTNYRGAMVDASGSIWLPLTPALKHYTVAPGADIYRQAGLTTNVVVDGYLAGPQQTDLLSQLRETLEEYLRLNRPDTTLADHAGSIAINPESLGLLPNTLSVPVAAVTAETAELPEALRYRVRFIARRGTGDASAILLDYTAPLAGLAGQRVTLSYMPATVDDQKTANLFGGLDLVPAYLIRLKPQIKINGRQTAVGVDGIDTGIPHRFDIEIIGPNGIERLQQTVVSGSYHAVAIAAGKVAQQPGEADGCELQSDAGGAGCPGTGDPGDTEYLGAGLLSRIAYDYTRRWTAAEDELAGLMNVAVLRPLPSVAIASNDMRVDMLLGQPNQISWQAVTLDAALRVAQPVVRDVQGCTNAAGCAGAAGDDTSSAVDFMRLAALQGSVLEHRIFEELFLVESISADKGLQLAASSSSAIVRLTAANHASQQSLLTHPDNVKADIGNWIARGYTVTTPIAPVTLNDWSGHVWRVDDPETGSGGYFIAGGLAGGSTTQSADGWILGWLRNALEAANTPPPNLNPGEVATLDKLSYSDGQTGEVGQPLENPLIVIARDATGLPVQGAPVTFEVAAGGGRLGGGGSLVVLTDEFGIAPASLTLGQSTLESPVFISGTGRYATLAGLNLVEARVTGGRGTVVTREPFMAVAYPGAASAMQVTHVADGTSRGGVAGKYSVVVSDEFGNPVANSSVTFSVGPAFNACDPPPQAPVNAAFFRDDECPPLPTSGQCGAPGVTVETDPNGVAEAGLINPNTAPSSSQVTISGPGAPFITTVSTVGECSPPAKGHIFVEYLTDESGNSVAAGRPGVTLSDVARVRLLYSKPSFEIREFPVGAHGDFDSAHTHYDLVNLADIQMIETSGSVSFSATGGASASGNSSLSVTLGPAPGESMITANASNIRALVDAIFVETGELTQLEDFVSASAEAGSVFAVLPVITDATSTNVPAGVDADHVYIDGEGYSTFPVEIGVSIEPANYRPSTVQLGVYEDGVLVMVMAAERKAESRVLIPRGTRFDPTRSYEAEVVLNAGGKYEIRSDRFALPLRQALIKHYTTAVTVSQDIDILNQRACNIGTEFEFELSEAADVTLEFIEETDPDNTTVLINGRAFDRGEHTLDITPGDLLPGRYTFSLTATARSDGLTEKKWGGALVEFATRNNLPVGHTIVKGVDVFDGNLSLGGSDMTLPGRGVPLELRRSYSSNSRAIPGPLGVGWHHNYQSQIVLTPCNEVTVIGAAGGSIRFVPDGSDGLKPLRGYHGTLLRNEAERSFDFYSVDGTRYHYRNFNRRAWDLVFIEDTNGNITKLGYDPSSPDVAKLITVEDPAGRRLEFTYEDRAFFGQVEAVPVITGVKAVAGDHSVLMSMEYEYDDHGNLIRADRDSGARSEQYAYILYELDDSGDPVLDDAGNPVLLPIYRRHKLNAYTDPNGNVTTYEYKATTQSFVTAEGALQVNAPYSSVIAVNEPGSSGVRTTRFAYDFEERDATVINPRNTGNGFRMNNYGSVERYSRPAGDTLTEWTGDDVLPLSRTNANEVRAAFTYDEDGNALTEAVAGSLRRYTYHDLGEGTIKNRVETQRDRNGHETRFEYDANGNLVKVTDPEGGVTQHTYNEQGDRLSTRDPNGNVTRFKYDLYGNLAETVDALGNKTATEWNARGLPVKITDARGRVTVNEYDSLGRLVRTRDALGGEVSYTYDAFGNKLTETDELNRTTTFEYDAAHRLTRVENPKGDFRRFEYDANGNKTLEQDWNGNVTAYEYDTDDRLIRKTEPEGKITEYTYDAVGNKLTETALNPDGPPGQTVRTTRFGYDEFNRVTEITDALNGVTAFTYDGEGNKLSETDAEGRVTEFEYDKNNRLVKIIDAEDGVTRFEYDDNGNKTAEIDAKGNRREFEYDKLNRLVRARDALGNVTTSVYDAVGNLVSVIDANLNETRFEYDELNRKVREIDPLNHATRFVYDAAGNLKEEHLPNGNVVRHTYDELNRLVRSEDNYSGVTGGQLLTKTYDANGNLTQLRDANNNLTVNSYDGLNRLTQQELPENRTLQFEYDVFGNKTREIDANNQPTVFEYDALNRLVTQTDARGNSTTFTYDRVGNKLTETDRRNNTTTFEYDDLNRPVSITDALTQSVTMTYDAVGNKLTETDKRNTITKFTYDRENRLLSTTKDGVLLLRREYDEVGNKVLEQDANGNKVVFIYDKRNQPVEESRPLAAITRFQYDAMGDKIQERDPEGRVSTFEYDVRQRLIAQTNGENETERYEYDGNGNRTRLQRPESNAWTYEYDAADRLISITDPLNGVTAYTYDNNGNRLTQTDGNQNTTTFEYDELNRRTRVLYADGADMTFSYDANGNRTGMVDANGLSFTFVYDALNRETEKQYPNPATPTGDDLQSIVNQYDANNNVIQITEQYIDGRVGTAHAPRVTTQAYDSFDRLIEKVDANGETIRYTYDANGNRKTVRDPDGKVTTYHYDALNRVSEVVNAQGITQYRYDRSSLKTRVTYPNGTQAQTTYDNAGRILTITNTQNLAVVSSYEYEYDDNGNRTRQVEVNGGGAETTTYEFDLNDRLIEVAYPNETTTYTYDAAYNRKTELTTGATGAITVDKTYTYNNRNQVTDIADSVSGEQIEYIYDNNGNRLSKTVTPAGSSVVTAEFIYDVRDQLRTIQQGGSTIGAFLYDYQGLRIRKQTATDTTRYVYDDQSVLLQTDDLGNTLAKYDYGPDKLLSLNHVSEGSQFYLFDSLGSVVNLTRPDGAIQARYQYDAWGNVRNEVGNSANVFGFTGHEMDTESGLVYMKARFYDPELGQFLNQDAFEGVADTPPSLHKYLYAAGNPVIYVDANGNFFILGDAANQLADLRNRALDAAGSLDNQSSLRGFSRVSAGFAGIGAGVFGVLEGGVRTLNFVGNLAVDAFADENSDSFFVKDARDQLAQSKAAIGQAVEFMVENPGEVGSAIVNSVAETGAGIIEGDPGAIARGTATLAEVTGGGGVAGVGAKLTAQTIKAAGKGVAKVTDKTLETARRVTERLVENASAGPRGRLARQVGAVGKDVDSNSIAKGFLQRNEDIALAQKGVSSTFTTVEKGSTFKFAGQSVADVAKGLREGKISPDDIPVEFVVIKGQRFAVNNRSLLALRRAGKEPTKTIDVTDDEVVLREVQKRLEEIEIEGLPFNTTRVRGGPNNQSSKID